MSEFGVNHTHKKVIRKSYSNFIPKISSVALLSDQVTMVVHVGESSFCYSRKKSNF